MALDGITIAALTKELRDKLLGGRISKIAQPEADELLLTIKTQAANERLLISAGASLPFVYLTDENKPSPMTAPNFCMLLRKHISGGHITDISQPGLERIIEISVDHLDEMGDPCRKIITIELMGKHSNIIFRTPEGTIIDAIKHVSAAVSSVREVLPGREYFIPNTESKVDLHSFLLCKLDNSRISHANSNIHTINETATTFQNTNICSTQEICGRLAEILCQPVSVCKALYSTFTGFSPVLAESICYANGIDSGKSANEIPDEVLCKLAESLIYLHNIIYVNLPASNSASNSAASNSASNSATDGNTFSTDYGFKPSIIFGEDKTPLEFEVIPLTQYSGENHVYYDSVSKVLKEFYAQKNEYTRIRQKSSDLRKIVQTALERNVKKYDLQAKQLKDTDKMDKYKLYGELLQTYGYSCEEGAKEITCENYYTGEQITIPLDSTISAMANSVKYFDRYAKLKRTKEAVTAQIAETEADIMHLRSIVASLEIATGEEDLAQIKDELIDSGYIRKRSNQKGKAKSKSKPFHYISTDGFHIYVGKNNYQNDELTFKVANSGDWWFHAKKMPGSHVIVRGEGKEITDLTFNEAASLAAYYSSGKNQGKVEIDYVKRKEVKKPNGAKPGFVVYYTNFSMVADAKIPDIERIE